MASRMRRVPVALLVAAALAVPFVIAPSAGAAKSRFGVVVVHGDGSTEERCVRLSATRTSGLDLLHRTDFDVYTQHFPSEGSRAVCWLDGEGQPTGGSCFGPAEFWNIWIQKPKNKSFPKQTFSIGSNVPANSVLFLTYDAWTEDPPGSNNWVPPQPPARRGIGSLCGR